MSKSVARNAFYSGVRTVASALFPLITFPYASRVLLPDSLGKVDFVTSVISYFALIAELGITSYATREGAGLREHRDELDVFASQVFSINLCSTLVAYLLLATLVAIWPLLHGYLALIAVQSVTILGTAIGVGWLYNIEEDYGYVMVRSLVVQAVSAVLLFALVKGPGDYVTYAAISVLSSTGANLFNLVRSRRYVRLRVTFHLDLARHLMPILILFGNAVAMTVYINTDVTLLGIIRSDYEVGVYGVAVKVYNMVKQLLNAIVMVSLPRLSLFCATGRDAEYASLLHSIAHGLAITLLPAITLLFLLADYVILIVGGNAYLAATGPLRILCVAMVPAVLACFVVYGVLLPNHGERSILRATAMGAISNLVCNLFAIPLFGMAGAASTTALAELCVLVTASWLGRHSCNFFDLVRELRHVLLTVFLGLCAMTTVHLTTQVALGHTLASFFASGVLSTATFFAVLVMCKDPLARALLDHALPRRQG